jgi:hypothetical protein
MSLAKQILFTAVLITAHVSLGVEHRQGGSRSLCEHGLQHGQDDEDRSQQET